MELEKAPEFWVDEAVNTPPASHKDRLIALVEEFQTLSGEVRMAEDDLSAKQERLAELIRVLIPSLMDEMGTSELKLEDKTKITLDKKVNASIPKAAKSVAHKWLIDNQYGGIIKSKVSADFPVDEVAKAYQVVEQLREQGVDAEMDESVHNQTLKSFVKERLEAGETLPDCFSVFEYREAKISLPKRKK